MQHPFLLAIPSVIVASRGLNEVTPALLCGLVPGIWSLISWLLYATAALQIRFDEISLAVCLYAFWFWKIIVIFLAYMSGQYVVISVCALWTRFVGPTKLTKEILGKYFENNKKKYPQVYRSEFRQLVIPGLKDHAGNPHGVSASLRSAADNAINGFLTLFGGTAVVSVSGSSKDVRRGMSVTRPFVFVKDMAMAFVGDSIAATATFQKLIDVDYYLEMGDLISDVPKMLYTFQPHRAGGVMADFTYQYVDEETVKVSVAGNSDGYRHKVWDYSTDHVSYFNWSDFSYTACFIDSHLLPGSRKIVLITPYVKYLGFPALVAYMALGEKPLKRITCKKNGDLLGMAFVDFDDGQSYTSIVSTRHFGQGDVVVQTASLMTTEVWEEGRETSSFQRVLLANTSEKYKCNSPLAATILKEWIESNKPNLYHRLVERLYSPPDYLPIYCNLPLDVGSVSGRMWLKPMYRAAYLPMRSLASDIACIAKRVMEPRKNNVKLTPQMLEYIEEFVSLTIPQAGVLCPKTIEETNAQMNRPSQRSLYERARDSLYGVCKIAAFQKAEAYANVNVPRNISTYDTTTKILYSGFTQAFTEGILKLQPWYAFGLSPRDLANRVHDLFINSLKIFATDFSKFDGTVNAIFRQLEKAALMRAFAAPYVDEVVRLHESQISCPAVTANGVHYDPDNSRGSGSPETAMFNSYDNAFVSYVSLRYQGLTPQMAYSALGLYGGDDGLNRGDSSHYTRACKDLGLDAKVEEYKREEKVWITFLGRIYIDPVVGNTSMIDFKRMIGKLHLTCSNELDNQVVARRKAISLNWTDGATPFIKEWCGRILFLTAHLSPKKMRRVENFEREDVSWWYHESKVKGNLEKKFPQPATNEEMIAIINQQFGQDVLTREWLHQWRQYLSVCATVEECTYENWFPAPELEVKLPVEMGGEVIGTPVNAPVTVSDQGKLTVPSTKCVSCNKISQKKFCDDCHKLLKCPGCQGHRSKASYALCATCIRNAPQAKTK